MSEPLTNSAQNRLDASNRVNIVVPRSIVGPTMAAALECLLFNQEPRDQTRRHRTEYSPAIPQEIVVDVENFCVNDLSVKVIDKAVVVKGKYKQRVEKQVLECTASRKLVKVYAMADNVDLNNISCEMTPENHLKIFTPLKKRGKSRLLPIQMMGIKRLQTVGFGKKRKRFFQSMPHVTIQREDEGNSAPMQVTSEYELPQQYNVETADAATQFNGARADVGLQTSEEDIDAYAQVSEQIADAAPGDKFKG